MKTGGGESLLSDKGCSLLPSSLKTSSLTQSLVSVSSSYMCLYHASTCTTQSNTILRVYSNTWTHLRCTAVHECAYRHSPDPPPVWMTNLSGGFHFKTTALGVCRQPLIKMCRHPLGSAVSTSLPTPQLLSYHFTQCDKSWGVEPGNYVHLSLSLWGAMEVIPTALLKWLWIKALHAVAFPPTVMT